MVCIRLEINACKEVWHVGVLYSIRIPADSLSGEIIAEVPDDVNWLSVASQFVDYVENYNTKLLVVGIISGIFNNSD